MAARRLELDLPQVRALCTLRSRVNGGLAEELGLQGEGGRSSASCGPSLLGGLQGSALGLCTCLARSGRALRENVQSAYLQKPFFT